MSEAYLAQYWIYQLQTSCVYRCHRVKVQYIRIVTLAALLLELFPNWWTERNYRNGQKKRAATPAEHKFLGDKGEKIAGIPQSRSLGATLFTSFITQVLAHLSPTPGAWFLTFLELISIFYRKVCDSSKLKVELLLKKKHCKFIILWLITL